MILTQLFRLALPFPRSMLSIRAHHPGMCNFAWVAYIRILIAAVFFGLAVLNLIWFAALKPTLADAGKDGWGTQDTDLHNSKTSHF
jgi:hypothetical protein